MKKITSILVCLICFSFTTISANYQRNIDDEQKVIALENKFYAALEKTQNVDMFTSLIKERIEKHLGKTSEEILKIDIYSKEQNSYKEYVLLYIYTSLEYNLGNIHRQVIENQYIRAIMPHFGENNLIVTDSTIHRGEFLVAQFWELSPDDVTMDFINKNVIEEKYKGKCSAFQLDINYGFDSKDRYSIQPVGDYQNEIDRKGLPAGMRACGKLSRTNSPTSFKRISPTTLMYVSTGQDVPPLIDFEVLEVKNINHEEDTDIKDLGNGFTLNQTLEESTVQYNGKDLHSWKHSSQNSPYIDEEGCNAFIKNLTHIKEPIPEKQNIAWNMISEKQKKLCLKETYASYMKVTKTDKTTFLICRGLYEGSICFAYDISMSKKTGSHFFYTGEGFSNIVTGTLGTYYIFNQDLYVLSDNSDKSTKLSLEETKTLVTHFELLANKKIKIFYKNTEGDILEKIVNLNDITNK